MSDDLTAGLTCRSCGRPYRPTHDAAAPGPTARHPFTAAVAGGLLIVDDPAGDLELVPHPYDRGGILPPAAGPVLEHPAPYVLTREQLAAAWADVHAPRPMQPDPVELADVVDLDASRRRDGWRLTDRRTPPAPLTAQRIAAAYDVPLYLIDDDRGRAEHQLRALEADRWADDGGPAPRETEPRSPLTVTVRPDAHAFLEQLAAACRPVFDVFRHLAEAFLAAGRALGIGLAARLERPVDRARRLHVDRQLRIRARRAARRRRIAARPWHRIAAATSSAAAALDALRTAAAAARDQHADLERTTDQLRQATR